MNNLRVHCCHTKDIFPVIIVLESLVAYFCNEYGIDGWIMCQTKLFSFSN